MRREPTMDETFVPNSLINRLKSVMMRREPSIHEILYMLLRPTDPSERLRFLYMPLVPSTTPGCRALGLHDSQGLTLHALWDPTPTKPSPVQVVSMMLEMERRFHRTSSVPRGYSICVFYQIKPQTYRGLPHLHVHVYCMTIPHEGRVESFPAVGAPPETSHMTAVSPPETLHMRAVYMQLEVVRVYGHPSVFITFTSNIPTYAGNPH